MTLADQHRAIVVALSSVPTNRYAAVDDGRLLSLARVVADAQKLVSTHAALIAGEIDRRSAPVLGSEGLAQRTGHRTPEELVRVITGSTKRDARTAVSVGQLASSPELQPWLASVAAALTSGDISVDVAGAIRSGLGSPSADVPGELLAAAAASLCSLELDPDRVFRLARDARDALDEAGIADREAVLHQKRSLRFWRTPDGGAQLHWVLDAESAAIVGEIIDRITSPRRGGPRFVDPIQAGKASRILEDPRTTEQLSSDAFVELLRQGADADSSALLGTGAPVIRVLVAAAALDGGSGHGRIEGSPVPISLETVSRLVCGADVTAVSIDPSGRVLDLGREQRLYTRRQRIALAVRDGGCRWPGCERPPSWTEAHHTRHWARDHGSTNIDDGILLCRHHHLLAHNNHWEIKHRGGEYLLVPPPEIDALQTPIVMPTKSAAVRELLGVGFG